MLLALDRVGQVQTAYADLPNRSHVGGGVFSLLGSSPRRVGARVEDAEPNVVPCHVDSKPGHFDHERGRATDIVQHVSGDRSIAHELPQTLPVFCTGKLPVDIETLDAPLGQLLADRQREE